MSGISVYQTLSAITQRAANLSEQKSGNKSMTDKPKEDKGKIKVDSSQDLHFQCDLESST